MSSRIQETTAIIPSAAVYTASNEKSSGWYSRVNNGKDTTVINWAKAVPPTKTDIDLINPFSLIDFHFASINSNRDFTLGTLYYVFIRDRS